MGHHIEVIARGLFVRRGRVLLCRHATKRYCYLPGGHVEHGEAAAAALVREMMEEAGVRIRVGQCIAVEEHRFMQGKKPRHEINIVLEASIRASSGGGVPVVRSLEAGIEFVWQPLAHLDEVDLKPASAREVIDRATQRPVALPPSTPRPTRATAWMSTTD